MNTYPPNQRPYRQSSAGSRPTGGSRPGQERGQYPANYPYQPDYYFRDGVLKEELVTTKAYDWAESFLHKGRETLTSAQLRRFYHEVKAIEARIEADGFETNKYLLQLLVSKVAYACPVRGDKKVPETFANFMWENLAQVRTEQEFRAFVKVFEAAVGFFYYLEGR